MPFGKYRGKPLDEVPTDYLWWVCHKCEGISPFFRKKVERELSKRESLDETDGDGDGVGAAPTVVSRWYRKLANEFHPDHGGSHEAMKAVNRARDLLLAELEAAG